MQESFTGACEMRTKRKGSKKFWSWGLYGGSRLALSVSPSTRRMWRRPGLTSRVRETPARLVAIPDARGGIRESGGMVSSKPPMGSGNTARKLGREKAGKLNAQRLVPKAQ